MDPRRLLPALLGLTACAVLAVVALLVLREPAPSRAVDDPVTTRAEQPRAVLAAWDRRRARAWAAGDVAALRRLYVGGSRAGSADVAMLRSYVGRGLLVRGLRTQLLALDVLRESPELIEVRVIDRVIGGTAVAGRRRLALPDDRASVREVLLRRVGGAWRVVEARDQASAAASTSATSSSWKS